MLSQIGDVFGQPIDVDDMRVEVGEPFLELAAALMAGVVNARPDVPIPSALRHKAR